MSDIIDCYVTKVLGEPLRLFAAPNIWVISVEYRIGDKVAEYPTSLYFKSETEARDVQAGQHFTAQSWA